MVIAEKRRVANDLVVESLAQAVTEIGLEVVWDGHDERINIIDVFSDAEKVGDEVAGDLIQHAATAKYGTLERPYKLKDETEFVFNRPAFRLTNEGHLNDWLQNEFRRKAGLLSRDAEAWERYTTWKERADHLGIDLKHYLIKSMVEGGKRYESRNLGQLLGLVEFENWMGMPAVDKQGRTWLEEGAERRFKAAAEKFVAQRTSISRALDAKFGPLEPGELTAISDPTWRDAINAEIQEKIGPAARQRVQQYLLEALRREARTSAGGIADDEPNELPIGLFLGPEPLASPEKLAKCALPPNLASFFPTIITPRYITFYAKYEIETAAKEFAIEIGRPAIVNSRSIPRVVWDAALGVTEVEPVLDWLAERCGIDLTPVLEKPGIRERRGWFYDLVLQLGDAQIDRIARAALEVYGYPPPEPLRRGFLNEKMSKRVRGRITALSSERVRIAMRPVVVSLAFREPVDLMFPGVGQDGIQMSVNGLRSKLPETLASCPEFELRQAWETEVCSRVVKSLELGQEDGNNSILWICEPLRVVEMRDPGLASRIRAIEKSSGAYRDIRKAIFNFGERYDKAVNSFVEGSSLDSLSDFGRAPGALLEKLGLAPGCRLLDQKWRETVARRFYRETEHGAHGLDGFEDIIEELGIVIGASADTRCGCRFYGEKKAQREFLMRNHWCTKGKLYSKAPSNVPRFV